MSQHELYDKYATIQSGRKDLSGEARVVRRDILPHLPKCARDGSVLDIGCGQGLLVRNLLDEGYVGAAGVDISPEQVQIAHQNGVETVTCADYREVLTSQKWAAVIATDLVEHLAKDEVIELFALVRASLEYAGRFIVRSPNATSPFGGNYQFSDFTHQTYLTPQSFSQLAKHSHFETVNAYPCAPIVHGWKSRARSAVFFVGSAAMRLMLTAETGETNHIVTQNFIGVAGT